MREANLSNAWQQLLSLIALQLVWQRHYDVTTDDTTGFDHVRLKSKQKLAKAAAGIESHDIEARYRRQYGLSVFLGLDAWYI